MFEINRKTKQIKLTRGNSCKIDITPLVKCEDSCNPIVLTDEDKVIFTVSSPSGRKYLQKILTVDDYDEEDISLNLVLFPEDTINMQPFDYCYDVLLVYDDGSTVTFIDNATFSLIQAFGTYKDLEVNENGCNRPNRRHKGMCR